LSISVLDKSGASAIANEYTKLRKYAPRLKAMRVTFVPNKCPAGLICSGLAGIVNLFGIESPGLTASLAIAQAVLAAL
jgi:L-2-hydroxyglutarate oxidase LhgO